MGALLLLTCLAVCGADISYVKHVPFRFHNGVQIYQPPSPMYAPEGAPSTMSPGNGRSYIKVRQGSFKVETEANEEVEILIVQANDLSTIGIHDEITGEKHLCCRDYLLGKAGCNKVGTLIVPSHTKVSALVVLSNATVEAPELTMNIKETGSYLVLIAYCGTEAQFSFSGIIEGMNPYGYLPGNMWSFLSFYGFLSVVYLLIFLGWFVLSACYWREIFPLQNFMAGVIGICAVEVTVWFFDYRNFNNTGIRDRAAFVAAVLLSSLRRTFSRMLVLTVSLGWGIVQPKLSQRAWIRITLLASAYFAFHSTLEMYTKSAQPRIAAVNHSLLMFMTVPETLCNVVFYCWIFIALYQTLFRLHLKSQELKYRLYVRFSCVLILSGLASIFVVTGQIHSVRSGHLVSQWQDRWWVTDAQPELIYLSVLLAMAFLWRPSMNSQSYSYQRVANDEFGDGDEDVDLEGLRLEFTTRSRNSKDPTSSSAAGSAVNGHFVAQQKSKAVS